MKSTGSGRTLSHAEPWNEATRSYLSFLDDMQAIPLVRTGNNLVGPSGIKLNIDTRESGTQ